MTTIAASLSSRERQRILERLDELAALDREMRRPGTLAAPRHEARDTTTTTTDDTTVRTT